MKRLLVALLLAVVLAGCSGGKITRNEGTSGSAEYDIVEVEGMTCIIFSRAYGFAASCDWSEYVEP